MDEFDSTDDKLIDKKLHFLLKNVAAVCYFAAHGTTRTEDSLRTMTRVEHVY